MFKYFIFLAFPNNDWIALLNIYDTVSSIAQNASTSFLDYKSVISKLGKKLTTEVVRAMSNEQNYLKNDYSE